MSARYLSDGTAVFSNLSLTGDVRTSSASASVVTASQGVSTSALTATSRITTASLNASRVTVTSRLSTPILDVSGGITASAASLDLRTNTVVLSLDTRANSSSLTIGQFRLVFAASGISLIYGSGASYYVVGQSSASAAQD